MRYVLGKGIISKFRPNENDKKMIEVMTTYFTNFAKFGSENDFVDDDHTDQFSGIRMDTSMMKKQSGRNMTRPCRSDISRLTWTTVKWQRTTRREEQSCGRSLEQ